MAAPALVVISTFAAAPSGCSLTSTEEVRERLTSTSFCSNLAKPFAASIVTEYLPGGRFNRRKRPSSSAVADCARMRLGLVTITVTPGTTAPLTSVTVPSIVPVVTVCAAALIAKSERPSANSNAVILLIEIFIKSSFLCRCLKLPKLLSLSNRGERILRKLVSPSAQASSHRASERATTVPTCAQTPKAVSSFTVSHRLWPRERELI